MAEKNTLPLFKGRPLVRCGKTVYYGDPSDEFVAVLQILSAKPKEGSEALIADKVLVQLLSTDEDLQPKDRIIKKAEKKGLYDALNIASIWLERSINA